MFFKILAVLLASAGVAGGVGISPSGVTGSTGTTIGCQVPVIYQNAFGKVTVNTERKFARSVFHGKDVTLDDRVILGEMRQCASSPFDSLRMHWIAHRQWHLRYLRIHFDRGCSQSNVIPCISYAAKRYHQSLALALCVAFHESTMNPYASNGTHFGNFQFDQTTWDGSPYARHSYWSAKWSALAAMWYFSKGEYSRWQGDGCIG
jgi:hypothetical protein